MEQTPTRQAKKRWRRRLSRARHTCNLSRGVIAFPKPPRGEGPAIGIFDDDPSGYPLIIRAPWFRDSASTVDLIDLGAEGS